jgi:hypothetical protein
LIWGNLGMNPANSIGKRVRSGGLVTHFFRLQFSLLLGFALAMSGCRADSERLCVKAGDCPAGYVCSDGRCAPAGDGNGRDGGARDAGLSVCEVAGLVFRLFYHSGEGLNCPPHGFKVTDNPMSVGPSHDGSAWRVTPAKSLGTASTLQILAPVNFDPLEVGRYSIYARLQSSAEWQALDTRFEAGAFFAATETSGEFFLGRRTEDLPDAGLWDIGPIETRDAGRFDTPARPDVDEQLPDVALPDTYGDSGIPDLPRGPDAAPGGDAGEADVSIPDGGQLGDSGIFDGGPDHDAGPDIRDVGPPTQLGEECVVGEAQTCGADPAFFCMQSLHGPADYQYCSYECDPNLEGSCVGPGACCSEQGGRNICLVEIDCNPGQVQCQNDEECAEFPGTTCVQGQCVQACQEDDDCTRPMTCQGNVCSPLACEGDEDCGDNQVCTDMGGGSICMDRCNNDNDCEGQLRCNNGVCQPQQ